MNHSTKNIPDMEETVKLLFELERKIFDQSCKILSLEFEVALRKEMQESMHKFYVQSNSL